MEHEREEGVWVTRTPWWGRRGYLTLIGWGVPHGMRVGGVTLVRERGVGVACRREMSENWRK